MRKKCGASDLQVLKMLLGMVEIEDGETCRSDAETVFVHPNDPTLDGPYTPQTSKRVEFDKDGYPTDLADDGSPKRRRIFGKSPPIASAAQSPPARKLVERPSFLSQDSDGFPAALRAATPFPAQPCKSKAPKKEAVPLTADSMGYIPHAAKSETRAKPKAAAAVSKPKAKAKASADVAKPQAKAKAAADVAKPKANATAKATAKAEAQAKAKAPAKAAGKDWGHMFYKASNAMAIRRKFGKCNQIFSFSIGVKANLTADRYNGLLKLAKTCILRLLEGAAEDEVQAWAREQVKTI